MTTKEEILAQVQQTLITTFKLTPEDVTPDKNLFTDLDLDSLDAIDMASDLAAKTKIRFSNDDLRNIRTIADVVDAIYAKQQQNQ